MNAAPSTPGRNSAKAQLEHRSMELEETYLKEHAHGLSGKKQLELRSSSPLPRGDDSALNKMDVNKLFEDDKGVVKMNHSPIKIEFSSPAKSEDMEEEHRGPEPKRLKLEMAFAPNLSQPNNGIETIEMIGSKSSPQKESDHVEAFELQDAVRQSKESRDSVDNTPTSQGKTDNILDLHRLTPLFDSDHNLTNRLPRNADNELFQIITTRNAELVDQVHTLNKSINEVINSCDSTVNKYRTEMVSLRHNYEGKLDTKAEEMARVVQECESLQDRTHLLKRRLEETRDEVRMLSQNQSILKNKYEAAAKEKENLLNKLAESEGLCLKLKSVEASTGEKLSILNSDHREALRDIKNLEEQKIVLTEVKDKAEARAASLDKEVLAEREEISKLKCQLDETTAAQQGSEDEKMKQVDELARAKEDLESRLAALQRNSTEEKENLESKIEAFESELQSVRAQAERHKKDVETATEKLEAKTQECQKWQVNYESINDDTEVRKAEVRELYSDLEEQREIKMHLETSILQLEEQVNDWRQKCDEYRNNYDKVALELESVHLKNNNIEAEHLAELEQLHDNLSSLQNTLKKDSELISELNHRNATLEVENEGLKDSQRDNSDSLEFKKEVEAWKEKYHNKELECNKSLKLLAEDLYIQYSSKHEQKVKLLKKGFETKYQGKLDKLSLQNEGLSQEIDQLKAQLSTERKEKQKLIGLLENHTSPPNA